MVSTKVCAQDPSARWAFRMTAWGQVGFVAWFSCSPDGMRVWKRNRLSAGAGEGAASSHGEHQGLRARSFGPLGLQDDGLG